MDLEKTVRFQVGWGRYILGYQGHLRVSVPWNKGWVYKEQAEFCSPQIFTSWTNM